MATITTRAGKGSPLTNTEVDTNFTNLNTDKQEVLSEGSFANGDKTKLDGIATSATANPHAIDGVTIQEEGSSLSTVATTLNFVGSGVTATGNGATKTITVSGGGSSGMSDLIDDTTPQLGGQLDLNGNGITTNSSCLFETTNANKSLEFSVQGHSTFKVTSTGVELSDSTDIAYFGGDGSS